MILRIIYFLILRSKTLLKLGEVPSQGICMMKFTQSLSNLFLKIRLNNLKKIYAIVGFNWGILDLIESYDKNITVVNNKSADIDVWKNGISGILSKKFLCLLHKCPQKIQYSIKCCKLIFWGKFSTMTFDDEKSQK